MSIAAINTIRRRLKETNWHRTLHALLSRTKSKQRHLAALETLKKIYRITQATPENDPPNRTRHRQLYKIAWIPRPKFNHQVTTATSSTTATTAMANQYANLQQTQPAETPKTEPPGIDALEKWRAMALVKASEIKTYELQVLLYNFAATHAATMDEEMLGKFIQIVAFCKYNEPKMLMQLSGREIPLKFLQENQAYNMLLRHLSPRHPALDAQCQINH